MELKPSPNPTNKSFRFPKGGIYLTTLMGYLIILAGSNACNDATSINTSPRGLSGIVTGPNGPEAGVWVIAETHDLLRDLPRSSQPMTKAVI